jgi:hypothetical protein
MEIEEIWWRLGQCKNCHNIGPASIQCPFCRASQEQTYKNFIQCLLTGYMREELQMTYKTLLLFPTSITTLGLKIMNTKCGVIWCGWKSSIKPPWKCPQKDHPNVQCIGHPRCPTSMDEPPPDNLHWFNWLGSIQRKYITVVISYGDQQWMNMGFRKWDSANKW